MKATALHTFRKSINIVACNGQQIKMYLSTLSKEQCGTGDIDGEGTRLAVSLCNGGCTSGMDAYHHVGQLNREDKRTRDEVKDG